jgi:hypothetical protein
MYHSHRQTWALRATCMRLAAKKAWAGLIDRECHVSYPTPWNRQKRAAKTKRGDQCLYLSAGGCSGRESDFESLGPHADSRSAHGRHKCAIYPLLAFRNEPVHPLLPAALSLSIPCSLSVASLSNHCCLPLVSLTMSKQSSVPQPVCLSHPSVRPSVCQTVSPSIHPAVRLSVCPPTHLSNQPPVRP